MIRDLQKKTYENRFRIDEITPLGYKLLKKAKTRINHKILKITGY